MLSLRWLRRDWKPLCFFTVLALAGTFPLVLRIGSALPAGGDSWVYYWNLWWVKTAVLERHVSPFFSDLLHHPVGASLWWHTLNVLPSVLVAPLTAIHVAVAYNVLVLLSFVCSAYGAFLLTRDAITISAPQSDDVLKTAGGLVAGASFAFCSYRYVHVMGHLDLTTTQWLPFVALFLLRSMRTPGWRFPVLAALAIVGAALTAWTYWLFASALAVLIIARALWRTRAMTEEVRRPVAALLLAGVLLIPAAVGLFNAGLSAARVPDVARQLNRYSGDVASLLVPSPLVPWSRAFAVPAQESIARPESNYEGILYLGALSMALGLLGIRRRGESAFWFCAFVLFVSLSLGPLIYVAGQPLEALSVVTPYDVLSWLPVANIGRVPGRFIVLGHLALAVLAGLGAGRLLSRIDPKRASGAAALIAVLVAAENAVVPFPLMSLIVPPVYERLAAEQGMGALIEIPVSDNPNDRPFRMMYQTVHQKPVLGGYLARGVSPMPHSAIPGIAPLYSLTSELDDVVPYEVKEAQALGRVALRSYGIEHLVIDRSLLEPGRLDATRAIVSDLAGSSVAFADDRSEWFRVQSRPEGVSGIWLDRGWSYLERGTEVEPEGRRERWRWMGQSSAVVVALDEPGDVRLLLRAQAFGHARQVAFKVAGSDPLIVSIESRRRDYVVGPLTLPQGTTAVEVVSLDGASPAGADPRELSIALFRLALEQKPSR